MYCHGVQWLVGAARILAERADREARPEAARQYLDTAYRLWLKTSAIPHSVTDTIETYGGQPNKQAADMVTTFDPGRMIWNGYTGAAGWMFRQALEGVLGLRLVSGQIVLSSSLGPAGELRLMDISRDTAQSPLEHHPLQQNVAQHDANSLSISTHEQFRRQQREDEDDGNLVEPDDAGLSARWLRGEGTAGRCHCSLFSVNVMSHAATDEPGQGSQSEAQFQFPTVPPRHHHARQLLANALRYVAPVNQMIDPVSGYPFEGWNQDPAKGLYLRSFTQLTAIGQYMELLSNIIAGTCDTPFLSRKQALANLAHLVKTCVRIKSTQPSARAACWAIFWIWPPANGLAPWPRTWTSISSRKPSAATRRKPSGRRCRPRAGSSREPTISRPISALAEVRFGAFRRPPGSVQRG